MIVAGMPGLLVGPGNLAAIHIVAGNSYYKHCAVAGRRCSRRRIGRVRKRKWQIGVEFGIEIVDLDTLRRGSGWREPVD